MWKRLRGIFFSGLIAILPIGLTIFVLQFLYKIIESWLGAGSVLGRFIRSVVGSIPSVAINLIAVILTTLVILAIGFVIRQYLGKLIFGYFEKLMMAIPFLRKIYSTFKQLTDSFFNRKVSTFKRVCLVEYPSKGLYMIGFETNTEVPGVEEVLGENLISIFIMSPPNPVTGMWLILPEHQVTYLDHITVDEGFRMVMSLGISIPDELRERLRQGQTVEPNPQPAP
jgi:uncharacterized membrane protein